MSTRSRECQIAIVEYFLGEKIDPNKGDGTYKDVLDHACQRNRTGVVRALFDEPTSLVKARTEARALACKRRLLPREVGVNTVPRTERASPVVRAQTRAAQVWSPSLGNVITALALLALPALIWVRKWLFDTAKGLWGVFVRLWDWLKKATEDMPPPLDAMWLRASLTTCSLQRDTWHAAHNHAARQRLHARAHASLAPVALARGVGTAGPSVASDCWADLQAEHRAGKAA